MIIDLESWETGYDDGLVGRPSQCAPGLDQFSYSGTSRLAHVVQGRTKTRSRTTLGCQPGGSFNDVVATLG